MELFRIELLYFIIGLIATTFGSIAGIGGGVIIKPALDTLGHFDVETIGVLSAATVFAMAVVSIIRLYFSSIKFKWRISVTLAASSIFGGISGKILFNDMTKSMTNLDSVTIIQSSILAFLMVLIFFYFKFKKVIQNYQLKNLFIIFIVGLFLGMIAAFLGVGGGPFNVAILSLFFSMNAKDASANSIFIIFFSQLSSLITTQVTTGFSTFDLGFLPFMVIGGVLGGFIGSILLNKVNNKHVEQIFSIGVILIFLLNAYNIIKLVV